MRLITLFFILLSALASSLTYADKSLDKESLFHLLTAEFAIYREQYQQAENLYFSEAKRYQNAELAERATRLALHNQRYADMLETALIWQKKAPNNADALFFTALAYAFNNQANIALDTMLRVLANGGESDVVQLVSLLSEDTKNDAYYLQALSQASLQYPKNQDVLLALALTYSRANNTKALEVLDKALALDKSVAVLAYARRIYLQFSATEKLYSLYRSLIVQQPDNLALQQQLIQQAYQQDLQTVLSQLNFLRKHIADNAYILLNYASVTIELKQFEQAEKTLQQMLSNNMQPDDAYLYLGVLYTRQQQYEKALVALLNVQPESSEYVRAQEYIARIYIAQGFYAQASARIDEQLNNVTDATQKQAFYLLKARILEKRGNSKEAYQLLSSLLEKQPDAIDIRYNRAMLAKDNAQLPQLETDLRYILAKDPNNAMVLNALGFTLADRTDRYREALRLIEQANQLLPEEPAILDSMGWVLYRLGRLQDALVYLRKATRLIADAEIEAHLGEVLWMAGFKDEAIQVLQNALKREPQNTVLLDTIKRLNVSF